MRERSWENSHSIARIWAEYDTIARRANEDRYFAIVASSGLRSSEADAVRASEAWGPLIATFRAADARGLDLDRALPALVQGRTISSADDVAALLHGRVTKWLESAGARRPADLILGLFPAAVGVCDPDMERALEDRRALIEHKARSLALAALESRQPWAIQLGPVPLEPKRREAWLRQADTVAAYRDRWHVNAGAVVGGEPRSHDQMAHQQSAHLAASTALSSYLADWPLDVGPSTLVIEPRNP